MDSAPLLLDASDPAQDDEALARKQSHMLERLAAKEAQRAEETLKKRSDLAQEAAPTESVQRFLESFASKKKGVEDRLEKLGEKGPGEVAQVGINEVAPEIDALEKSVSDAVYFLPSYEVRAAQGSVAQLRGSLDAIKSTVVPKRKFSFGAKKAERQAKQSDDSANNDGNIGRGLSTPTPLGTNGTKSGRERPKGPVQEGPGLRGLSGKTLIEAVNEGEFALSHLEDCSIYLKGMLRALYIDNLKNCRVFTGPVTGAVHIEQVTGSVLVLASHQIRIHHTSSTDFYLRVRSRPIVEHTKEVRFAPYVFSYVGLDEQLQKAGLSEDSGDWANVDDFRWLRATQSPNWSLLPEADRLTAQHLPEPH